MAARSGDNQSQEVVRLRLLARNPTALLRGGLKYRESATELFVQFQNGGHIAATIAIIRCRPNGQNGGVEMPLVALHHQLMSATDHFNIISLVELGHHVRAEEVSKQETKRK